jgi:MFS family permease
MRYDLLASRNGRLATFFLLYLTEGIPLGFTATAIATQMRRQGVGVEAIGAFVASLYLPWALKWIAGPFVDVFASDRLGRRRAWIVGTQLMMVATLLFAYPLDFATQIALLSSVIFVHNLFAATQDVAIDALAVNTLWESERGIANGLMFAGAYLGQTIGGSGVLFLTPHIGFPATYFVVAGAILLVTVFVALPLRERPTPRPPRTGPPLEAVGMELWGFVRDSGRAFLGSRAAFLGLLFALLPAGAYALGLALQSNLAVELGMSDPEVATLSLWSTIVSAVGCVAGGWCSDRFGRRATLAVFVLAMSVPTAMLAWQMQQAAWIMPVALDAPARPPVPPALVQAFWVACLVYSLFNGLMYGIRSALFMDITTARVAATQFTAYMALLNFAISYSARWQGWALARWGYPVTLALDAALGLLCLALLPWMRPTAGPKAAPAPGADVEPAAG